MPDNTDLIVVRAMLWTYHYPQAELYRLRTGLDLLNSQRDRELLKAKPDKTSWEQRLCREMDHLEQLDQALGGGRLQTAH